MSDSPHVVDLEVGGFEKQVIERSRSLPVLVDFWAAWCRPCLMLAPVLVGLAEEKAGAFELVKVNTDIHKDVARAARVNGIPDVRLFIGGEQVDGFVGARQAPDVLRFLAPYLNADPAEPKVDLEGLIAAAERIAPADSANASAAWEAVLEAAPDHGGARLGLARVALAAGEFAQVREHVGGIPLGSDEHEVGQNMIAAISIVESARRVGTREECDAKRRASPKDPEALFAAGGHSLGQCEFRPALEAFLDLVKVDRKWGDEAGRQAMLVVFSLVGVRSEMADEFRDLLSRALY